MISAEIVLATEYPGARPIYTSRLVYPSWIHTHLLTHRVFSRNTSSARAIPTKKFARLVRENPAMPIYWGMDCKGMKAQREVEDIAAARAWWLAGMEEALQRHEQGMRLGLHKEILNRILQPYQHTVCLVTATEYEGWDLQRGGDGVDSETALLAKVWKEARESSRLQNTCYHLPYVTQAEQDEVALGTTYLGYTNCGYVSAARCARVSFLLENKSFAEDWEDGLQRAEDRHPSPFEHQARITPVTTPSLTRNFRDWTQFRGELGM